MSSETIETTIQGNGELVPDGEGSDGAGENVAGGVSWAKGDGGDGGDDRTDDNRVEEGVLVPASRDKTGKFLPGFSGNPDGRNKRTADMLNAISNEFPPEKVIDLLKQQIAMATKDGSWRGLDAAIHNILDRLLGKPKQTSEHVRWDTGSLIKHLEHMQQQQPDTTIE